MKKGFIIGLSIFLGIFALIAAVVIMFYVHLSNQMKWSVHEPMDRAQQVELSSMALIPDVADQFIRYGDRGLRDSEYMAESYLYEDLDDMLASLPADYAPCIKDALKEGYAQDFDIKGEPVKRYEIHVLPQATREELDPKYEYYFYGTFHHYYVLQYDDGTYRFAAETDTT